MMTSKRSNIEVELSDARAFGWTHRGPFRLSAFVAVALATGVACVAGPALAGVIVTLGDATYFSTASYGNSACCGYGILVSNAIDTAGTVTVNNGGYATISNYPNPTLTVYAHGAVLGPYYGYYGDSEAHMNYVVDIIGPDAVIPVDLSYSINASSSGPDGSGKQAYVAFRSGAGIFGGSIFAEYGVGSDTTSGTVSGLAYVGLPLAVYLDALVVTGEGNVDQGYLQLDPIFSIDPSFGAVDPNYLQDYTIVVSSGVGNSPSAIPEPSTWGLLIAGAFGVGAILRRRRPAKIGGGELSPG